MEATTPCSVYLLGANPTPTDLEVGYRMRGVDILECNGRRKLAVETEAAGKKLRAEYARRRLPWYKRIFAQ